MKLTMLALRFRWLQMPAGMLIVLLQRTPVLRVAVQFENVFAGSAPAILRSVFAVGAMGAYNSLAGATVFNVTAAPTAAAPASGAANATFAVAEDVSVAASIAVSVSGAPGNPKSYSVSGTLPAGLALSGGVGTYVNVTAPYKMTISGTPTAAGSYPLTITAWDGSNGTGGNSAKIKVNITVAGAAAIAPSITTQPGSVTVTAGGPASFTVAASGTPAPTYQWQKGGVNIAGATGTTFSITSVVAGDAGNYTAIATNSAGSATSATATLTVNAAAIAPAITTQPVSQTVAPGAAASFSASASGTPTPTYQWQKGGVNIAGATGASYSITSVVAGDAGNYAVVATNSAGSVTSATASLTVSAATSAPTITTQPTSQTVAPGAAVSFAVTASGNPTPTYQWQKGGVNIAGATGATYSLASVVAGDAGNYAVIATNSAGSVTSATASLTVSTATSAPTISTQPASQTVAPGAAVSFSVTASGNPTPTYQWQKGGVNIAGATGATYSIANVVAGDAGNYTLIATNSAGSATSNVAALTVSAPSPAPVSATLLPNQAVVAGHDVALSAAGANGTIQWQVSTDNGLNWQNLAESGTYSGVTSGILEILKVTGAMNGYAYRCLAGGTASSATILSVVQGYFAFPTAVGTDSTGNLFVSDASTQTIQKIGSSGQVTLLAGSAGQAGSLDGTGSAARFNQPGALAVAADGTLGVADTANNSLRQVSAGGVVTTLAGSAGSAGAADGTGSAARFGAPGGIARDASGNYYVADSANHTIRKVTATGVVSTLAGGAGTAGAADGTGTGARFNTPAGVAVDGAGNVFVADSVNHTIRRISASGTVTTLAGLAGSSGSQDGAGSAARFNHPGGLALGSSGELYLADTGNSTIRRISAAGVVTTVAGLAGIPGLMDGTGGAAWFDQPEGLTLGADGNLVVADTGNAVIRKVTLTGTVNTLTLSTAAVSNPSPSTSPSAPTPVSPSPAAASSAGAGGGAVSPWFAGIISLALLFRRSRRES